MPAVNECFVSTVRDISSDGNGVVQHPEGKTFFVPGVLTGESGEFRITGFKGRYGFAELIALQKKSPQRVAAPCPYHGFGRGNCGGCPWQFIDYPEQLKIKQARISLLLKKTEKNIEKVIESIWPAPEIFGYRNRAQLKTDGEKIGFVTGSSRDIAGIEDCLVLNQKNRQLLQAILQTLPREEFKPKPIKSRKRRAKQAAWNTLDIDDAMSLDDVVLNQRRPFRQANSAQNQKMRIWLKQKLSGIKNNQNKALHLVELFAGSGNFTEVISALGFENILAVEGSEEAVSALKNRQLPGVKALQANLFLAENLSALFLQDSALKNNAVDILVLDPPREGFKGIEGLFPQGREITKRLNDIFYISCNPATFQRDVEVFYRHGFSLQEVQPVDQFPHTPHIELLAHLARDRKR